MFYYRVDSVQSEMGPLPDIPAGIGWAGQLTPDGGFLIATRESVPTCTPLTEAELIAECDRCGFALSDVQFWSV
jgi:hypothetical protein